MNLLQTLLDPTLAPAATAALLIERQGRARPAPGLAVNKVTLGTAYGRRVRIVWSSATPPDPTPMRAFYCRSIKDAVASGDIARARKQASQAVEIWPEDADLQRLSQLIALPRVLAARPAQDSGSREANRRWMREHAREHRGMWVAVRDGRLQGAASTIGELRAVVGDIRSALVTQIS